MSTPPQTGRPHAVSPDESSPPETGVSVLLVDDDEDALQLLSMVLGRSGYSTTSAQNSDDAIRLALEHAKTLEVVLLDIMMPGDSDGYEVCRHLKADSRTRNLPIIVLSAKSSTRDMAHSYAAGAFQHIIKPYDVQHLIAVVDSMVKLRRLQREALTNAEKYRAMLDNLPLEMLLISPDLRILEMNSAFSRKFPDAKVGDPPLPFIYDEAPAVDSDHPTFRALKTGETQDGVVEGIRDGNKIYRRVRAAPIKDEDGNVLAIIDITDDVTDQLEMEENLRRQVDRHNRALHQQDMMAEGLMYVQRQLKQKNQELEEAKQKLEMLSITDDLTGLYNKRYFNHAIEQEARRSSRYEHSLALLMIDIDHFKEVNDTYLHASGDLVLKELGSILMQQLRETDTVARYGGEEFVAILPETDSDTAKAIAERLRETVGKKTFVMADKTEINVTISVGVASVLSDSVDIEDLLTRADEAMYQAKNGGRDRVVVAD